VCIQKSKIKFIVVGPLPRSDGKQRKENAMSAKIQTYLNAIPAGRELAIGLIVIPAIAVTAGFVWMQTDQLIAPPGLRVLDWLWRVFVCWCPV
jgi:hypothetical protein